MPTKNRVNRAVRRGHDPSSAALRKTATAVDTSSSRYLCTRGVFICQTSWFTPVYTCIMANASVVLAGAHTRTKLYYIHAIFHRPSDIGISVGGIKRSHSSVSPPRRVLCVYTCYIYIYLIITHARPLPDDRALMASAFQTSPDAVFVINETRILLLLYDREREYIMYTSETAIPCGLCDCDRHPSSGASTRALQRRVCIYNII